MTRNLIVILILLTLAATAHAIGVGGEGLRFGRLGAMGKGTAVAPPSTNALLLEDGSSILLLEDGASLLCLEGGC